MDPADRIGQATLEVREFAKAGLRDTGARSRARLLEHAPLLRKLPAAAAAQENSTAQFEYLTQAIQDAIEVLQGRAHETIESTEDDDEVRALQSLFGLTDETRAKLWRYRQEIAARELHLSWDHFRHGAQDELLRAVAEGLLIAADRKASATQSRFQTLDGGLVSCATQQDIEADIIDYVRQKQPRSATLLELSTATIQPLLEALKEARTRTRILVANPERFTSDWQRERVRATIAHLFRSDFVSAPAVTIRMYRESPTVRGRLIGDVVSLGWYTHRDNRRIDALDPTAAEVWGHDNAMVVGRLDEPNGAVLATWFNREFHRLWSHRHTIHTDAVPALLGIRG